MMFSWWFQPIWKYIRQIGSFPHFSEMENKNIFETTSETNMKKWKIPRIWRRIPWKSKTIKIIVPNLGWLKFPTKTIVFGENLFF